MRGAWWIVAFPLWLGCTTSSDACGANERQVCRAAADCRCGPVCTATSGCADAGALICVAITGDPTGGVCVDPVWATGRADGRYPCGAELCLPRDACVDWGADGIHCAPSCAANGDCAAGCCSPIREADGTSSRNVCAPSARFRCLPGSPPTQQGCTPRCDATQVCMQAGTAAPRCLTRCTADAECPGTCCAPTSGGVSVCAPTRSSCATPGAVDPTIVPRCSNLDGCVMVTYAARGDHCADIDSVEVRVQNNCDREADIQICYERRDGACECGIHRAVAPGAAGSPPFWACNLTGRYRVSARAAYDAPRCQVETCR